MVEAGLPRGYVLHVYEQDSPWSRAVSEALGGMPVDVETRPDVYAALALLLGRRGRPCRGLFVCLDWLDERDQVFFDLATRHLGPIPVWVYANRRPVAELAQPLRAHRVRLLEEEGQLALICSQFPHHPRVTPSPGGVSRPADGADPQKPECRADAGPGRAGVPETASSPVPPVPWLSNPSRPTRTPPAAGGVGGAAPTGSTPAVLAKPILTREELDALISDAPAADGRAARSQP